MIYADGHVDAALVTFTREPPDCWTAQTGRVDSCLFSSADLEDATAFVCGSNRRVQAARQLLLEVGCEPQRIRTERLGLTG